MSGGGGGRKRRVEVEHMLLLMSLSTTRDAWLLLSAPAALSTCTTVREVKEWGEGGCASLQAHVKYTKRNVPCAASHVEEGAAWLRCKRGNEGVLPQPEGVA